MATEWTELFADFEQSLKEWLARAVELPTVPTPRQTELAVLSQFGERLRHLQTYLDKAERDAEQALTPLTTDIQQLAQWIAKLTTVRTNLAEGARSQTE